MMPKVIRKPKMDPTKAENFLITLEKIRSALGFPPVSEISLIVGSREYEILKDEFAGNFFDHVYLEDKIGCVGRMLGMYVYLATKNEHSDITLVGMRNAQIDDFRETYGVKEIS